MWGWIILGIAVIIILFVILPGLRLIGSNEVGILTKNMFGKKMPEGQIIAREGEIGIQARTLMPGLYWKLPIVWSFSKVPVVTIDIDSIGLVESIDGEPLPKGRVLGDEVECNQFQDAGMFLNNHGKKGPQVGILRPGTYRINTRMFHITKSNADQNCRKYHRYRYCQRRYSFAFRIYYRSQGQNADGTEVTINFFKTVNFLSIATATAVRSWIHYSRVNTTSIRYYSILKPNMLPRCYPDTWQ